MSVCIGSSDLAVFLAQGHVDPEEAIDYREPYQRLDRFLKGRGFSGHSEPESLPEPLARQALDSFPVFYLHALRRAYVLHRFGTPLSPIPPSDEIDRFLSAEYQQPRLVSHLVHFPEQEGFYVPIDFARPLVADAPDEVLGGVVGSSFRLLAELRECSPSLGIDLSPDGLLSETVASDLANVTLQSRHRFGIERVAWFAFFEAACESIRFGSAVRLG
jgi:hypothetical protein